MTCPKCKFEDSKVVDSRPLNSDASIRRRRECLSCKFRFTTYEYIQISPIMVIKKSGGREEYSIKKNRKKFTPCIQQETYLWRDNSKHNKWYWRTN